jgi:formate C-acetyltransferase
MKPRKTMTDYTTHVNLTPRIARLLHASRLRGDNPPPTTFDLDCYNAYAQFADLPLRERQARALATAIVALPVYLFPNECLTGMIYHLGYNHEIVGPHPFDWAKPVMPRVEAELPQNAELVAMKLCTDNAIPGHITWHWDWLLEKGVTGMLGDYRNALDASQDVQAAEYFQAVIIILEAMLHWNDRHITALEAALTTAPDVERARLEAQLALCRCVPAHPARTFREAVQSFYFQYLVVMRENPYGGNGPGRFDYFLWPYLERDLAAGIITLEEAYDLIQELYIRIHERIQRSDGWVETIVVGGSHPDGSSAVNPLSHLMVQAFIPLEQTHPAVYVRMPEHPPAEFVDLAVRYLLTGHNRAQILNDRAIIPAMTRYGMPREDAAMYTCGGCMEIVPQGMNSDLLFAATHNVPKTVEITLTGGECLRTGQRLSASDLPPLTAFTTFDALYEAFSTELARELHTIFRRLDLFSEGMAQMRPAYLVSSMIADCFARGREMHDGGARHHDYGATPLGVPNAGDALYAVKRAVFDDRLCTAEELLAALHANFTGYEVLRAALGALPKFGQQHAEADAMTRRVLTTVCGIYDEYRNRWGGRVKPIIFTFLWAPEAGDALGATAYGDLAGVPIAQGLTPQSQAMVEGITAAIGSHTSLPLELVAGAASSMWDLDAAWATPEIVHAIVVGFLRLGGQIFQGNTTDVAELRQAQAHPEDYRNLVVRVGGFSAHFTSLTPAVQEDIIQRYRHRQ